MTMGTSLQHAVHGQPRSLFALALAEFWDRFSYYGLQALIVLYVTKVFLFSDSQAYQLYGTFTALGFAMTIVGGIVADRYLGVKHTVLLGAVLMALGNFILIYQAKDLLYLGLAILVCGIGFFKPSNASLVGILYEKDDPRRAGGFSLFYIGMNGGALLGPIAYGYLTLHLGWHYGFVIGCLGMGIALVLCYFAKPHHSFAAGLIKKDFKLAKQIAINITVYSLLIIAIGAFYILMLDEFFFGKLLGLIGVVTLLYLTVIITKSNHVDKKRLIALTYIAFFSIFYFACSLQTATTLTVFIEQHVDRSLFGMTLPTMMFLSIQPFFIILMAPFVAKLWTVLGHKHKDLSPTMKVALGLLCGAVGFLIFALSALNTLEGSRPGLILIILGNWVLGMGELFILPTVLAAISHLAPERFRTTMNGVLFLALAYSGYLAGLIAKVVSMNNAVVTAQVQTVNYAHGFLQIGLVALAICGIMFCFNPFFQRMLDAK